VCLCVCACVCVRVPLMVNPRRRLESALLCTRAFLPRSPPPSPHLSGTTGSETHTLIHIHAHTHARHAYTLGCVCVCVCLCVRDEDDSHALETGSVIRLLLEVRERNITTITRTVIDVSWMAMFLFLHFCAHCVPIPTLIIIIQGYYAKLSYYLHIFLFCCRGHSVGPHTPSALCSR